MPVEGSAIEWGSIPRQATVLRFDLFVCAFVRHLKVVLGWLAGRGQSFPLPFCPVGRSGYVLHCCDSLGVGVCY